MIGWGTASVDPPDHLVKKLVFVALVETERILGLEGLRDTEGDAAGVRYPSRPLGNTVLNNLRRSREIRII